MEIQNILDTDLRFIPTPEEKVNYSILILSEKKQKYEMLRAVKLDITSDVREAIHSIIDSRYDKAVKAKLFEAK